jgi:hypothetical protein
MDIKHEPYCAELHVWGPHREMAQFYEEVNQLREHLELAWIASFRSQSRMHPQQELPLMHHG